MEGKQPIYHITTYLEKFLNALLASSVEFNRPYTNNGIEFSYYFGCHVKDDDTYCEIEYYDACGETQLIMEFLKAHANETCEIFIEWRNFCDSGCDGAFEVSNQVIHDYSHDFLSTLKYKKLRKEKQEDFLPYE